MLGTRLNNTQAIFRARYGHSHRCQSESHSYCFEAQSSALDRHALVVVRLLREIDLGRDPRVAERSPL